MAINPRKSAQEDAENIKPLEIKEDVVVKEKAPEVESAGEVAVEDGERSLDEIREEAELNRQERQKAKMDMESHKEDVGTLASAAAVQQARKSKTFQEIEIEGIMQAGLDDYYKKMTPAQQQEFKVEGEKAATQIADLMKSAKLKVVKVLELIRRWLQIIPGVNKYFLEKESKIKTDNLIRMKKEGMLDKK